MVRSRHPGLTSAGTRITLRSPAMGIRKRPLDPRDEIALNHFQRTHLLANPGLPIPPFGPPFEPTGHAVRSARARLCSSQGGVAQQWRDGVASPGREQAGGCEPAREVRFEGALVDVAASLGFGWVALAAGFEHDGFVGVGVVWAGEEGERGLEETCFGGLSVLVGFLSDTQDEMSEISPSVRLRQTSWVGPVV